MKWMLTLFCQGLNRGGNIKGPLSDANESKIEIIAFYEKR